MNNADDLDFDELLGQEFDFYGADGCCFKLDDVAYSAIESEDSSCLKAVQVCTDPHDFHPVPIARVVIENGCWTDDIYDLTDLHDGRCWLSFGTESIYGSGSTETQFVFDSFPEGCELSS